MVGSRVSQGTEGGIQLLAMCLPAPVPLFSWAATLFSHLLRGGPILPGVGNETSLDPGTGSRWSKTGQHEIQDLSRTFPGQGKRHLLSPAVLALGGYTAALGATV